jgi:hypothetical protein
MANRPRSLIGRHAGVGLDPGSGGTLDLDVSELTAKTVPVMADSMVIVDSDDDSSKKATLTNTLKILGETAAGDKTTSGLTEIDGVMKINVGQLTANTAPAITDKIIIEVTGVNKSVTIANAIKAIGEAMIGGAGATASLAESDGVIKIDIGNTASTVAPDPADKLLIEVSGVNKSTTITNFLKAVGEGMVNAAGATGGLSEVNGVMRINVGGITATIAPAVADLMLVEVGGVNKSASITNLQKAFGEVAAGEVATSGLSESDGVLKIDPTDEVAVLHTGYLLTQNAAGEPHKDKIEDVTELMAGTVTATGIKNSNGVLSVVPCSLATKTPIAADIICMGDSAAPTLAKGATITQVAEVLAGAVVTTGIENTAGVLSVVPMSLTAKATPLVADGILIGDSAAPTLAKVSTITEVIAVVAGSSAATGHTAAAGVLTNAIKIAHLVAGEMSSLFFFSAEVDYSTSANLVATKISNHSDATALAAKGTLIAAFISNTVANTGGTATVLSIAKDGTPTAKMCADVTNTVADTVFCNALNNGWMPMPVSGANAIVDPASEDIYVVAAADASRAHTGKVFVFLVFKKTA